jgi:hypothetical protein
MALQVPSGGPGRQCIVCRRAIELTEVERELDGVGVVLIAQEACYKLWHQESVARRTATDLNGRDQSRQPLKST